MGAKCLAVCQLDRIQVLAIIKHHNMKFLSMGFFIYDHSKFCLQFFPKFGYTVFKLDDYSFTNFKYNLKK